MLWYFTCCPLADSDALTQRSTVSFQDVVNRIMICQHFGIAVADSHSTPVLSQGTLCRSSWTKLTKGIVATRHLFISCSFSFLGLIPDQDPKSLFVPSDASLRDRNANRETCVDTSAGTCGAN